MKATSLSNFSSPKANSELHQTPPETIFEKVRCFAERCSGWRGVFFSSCARFWPLSAILQRSSCFLKGAEKKGAFSLPFGL